MYPYILRGFLQISSGSLTWSEKFSAIFRVIEWQKQEATMHEMLLDGLPDIRWNYLRGLADAAEDEGDDLLALGWRWLADNRRWPLGMKWRRYGFRLKRGPLQTMAEYGLPPDMFLAAASGVDGEFPGTSSGELIEGHDLPKFLYAVAVGIGAWLSDTD
jgi:hypothetical protein